MELRHLRHFIAVAEELHFARAAERLGMEQSPLSRSIRDLEDELQTRLFHRTTRRTWLTRTGHRFLGSARRILADVDAVIASLRSENPSAGLNLSLGLAEHAAGEAFVRLLIELAHREPPISVELREMTSSEVLRLVEDGGLDAGLVLEARSAPGIQCVIAWNERLVLVVPFGHPLDERECVSISEVAGDAFVLPLPEAAPGFAKQIQKYLLQHGVCPARTRHAAHQNSMLSLIATGVGVGVMVEPITRSVTDVAVVPLSDMDAEVTSWLLYREDDESDAIAAAIETAAAIASGEARESA